MNDASLLSPQQRRWAMTGALEKASTGVLVFTNKSNELAPTSVNFMPG